MFFINHCVSLAVCDGGECQMSTTPTVTSIGIQRLEILNSPPECYSITMNHSADPIIIEGNLNV